MNYMNCAKRIRRIKRTQEGHNATQTYEPEVIEEELQKVLRNPQEEHAGTPHAWGLADLMPCFHPLHAWRAPGGGVAFTRGDGYVDLPVELPCGQCTGCRIEKSRQWAVRCVHESQMHDRNSFATLTYNEESLPRDRSLSIRHWQLFAKRLRKQVGPFRYFHCGEYTDKGRPHYHACIFGVDFGGDRQLFKKNAGKPLYRSAQLEAAWGKGFCTVGELTYESAAYVSQYIMKKMTGPLAEEKYQWTDPKTGEIHKLQPEYISMSRRPGVGSGWFEKYREDVYPEDEVIIKGRRFRPPRFYDEKLGEEERKEIKFKRAARVKGRSEDLTPERLEVRERVLDRKIKDRERNLE